MKPWGEQVDELVDAGKYAEALALLDTIDAAFLPDKVCVYQSAYGFLLMLVSLKDRRTSLAKALDAVSQLRSGEFDRALDSFVTLNINPAKVISLYPESISGRLSVPREHWIQMFGGPTPKATRGDGPPSSSSSSEHGGDAEERGPSGPMAAPNAAKVGKSKNSLDSTRSSGLKDPETASIISKKGKQRKGPSVHRYMAIFSSRFRR
jgi:hypothetical protein